MAIDFLDQPESCQQLLTISQTAAVLGVAEATVGDQKWRARVRLPTVKVGRLVRFHPQALAAWCQARTQQGGA